MYYDNGNAEISGLGFDPVIGAAIIGGPLAIASQFIGLKAQKEAQKAAQKLAKTQAAIQAEEAAQAASRQDFYMKLAVTAALAGVGIIAVMALLRRRA